jgi:uncharacterized protein (DUF1778 family)
MARPLVKSQRIAARVSPEVKGMLRELASLTGWDITEVLEDAIEKARTEWSNTLIIVADCTRCGEAINAAEPRIYWDGERICESCEQIALMVNQ